jgi:hypothetical protein
MVRPITISQVQFVKNPQYKRACNTLRTDHLFFKNMVLSVTKLSLQSTTRKHSCHGPQTQRSQTQKEKPVLQKKKRKDSST